MNTKPRAKKFRIRRSASLMGSGVAAIGQQTVAQETVTRQTVVEEERVAASGGGGGATAQIIDPPGQAQRFEFDKTFDNDDDGFGEGPFATARGPEAEPEIAAPSALNTDIDSIRREGLTGRQLRMARRVAQKHGLAPTSDFDAVRLLRINGIDPFERSTMLELVIADGKPTGGHANLPQTIARPNLPAKPQVLTESSRAQEIMRIQRDIARRRRHRLAMLLVRLAIFVFLPTVAAGYYYYQVATPLYATRSEFLIQKADAGTSSLGSLFSGTQFATSQDSITVQSFLKSREAMMRLDAEEGFKAHFSQDWIDPIKRLPKDASNEEAYKLYQKDVKIGFDPTEGIIKMEVIAADPQTSAAFSTALIHYAEEQVDHLSARLREDQMTGAQDSYDDAERKMKAAQEKVLDLQEKLGVLDPGAESGSLMGQISGFETQLRQKKLELQALLDNAQPNQARVDGVKGDIQRLESLIAELRGQLTKSQGGNASLARITGELRMAEADLETRQTLLAQALQQLETARIEANKQVRYLAMGVRPVAPDQPTYPRKFENTILAFLIFSGIYLMISLTASILREQVTS